MAVSVIELVDLLFKKLVGGMAKTDGSAFLSLENERFASGSPVRPSDVWVDVDSLPDTPPESAGNALAERVSVPMTEIRTSRSRRAWDSGRRDWIGPSMHPSYRVEVTMGGRRLYESGSKSGGVDNNDEFYFDYGAGTLLFIGTNLPPDMPSNPSIVITGHVYRGRRLSDMFTVVPEFSTVTEVAGQPKLIGLLSGDAVGVYSLRAEKGGKLRYSSEISVIDRGDSAGISEYEVMSDSGSDFIGLSAVRTSEGIELYVFSGEAGVKVRLTPDSTTMSSPSTPGTGGPSGLVELLVAKGVITRAEADAL